MNKNEVTNRRSAFRLAMEQFLIGVTAANFLLVPLVVCSLPVLFYVSPILFAFGLGYLIGSSTTWLVGLFVLLERQPWGT